MTRSWSKTLPMLFHAILPTTPGCIFPVLWMRKLRLRHHVTCPVHTAGKWQRPKFNSRLLHSSLCALNHGLLVGTGHGSGSCHNQSPRPWTLWRNKDRKGTLLLIPCHSASGAKGYSFEPAHRAPASEGRPLDELLWFQDVYSITFFGEALFSSPLRWRQDRVFCLPWVPHPQPQWLTGCWEVS